MDYASSIIEGLYEKLLLRDLLAKIVPGAVLIAAVALRSGDLDFDSLVQQVGKLPVAVLVLAAGCAWSIGFGAQLGRGLVEAELCQPSRRSLRKAWAAEQKLWGQIVKRRASLPAERRHILERLTVIKEATGNLAFALLGASVLTLGSPNSLWPAGSAAAAGGMLLLVSLDHRRRELMMQHEMAAEPPVVEP
ncbi:MAG: hypothetical protein ACKVWR_14170 [Acidimicrobiales bacterium]